MKENYSTSDVANIIGIHPNTVRLYEELKLITTPERKANGYRVFTKIHIQQFQIARITLNTFFQLSKCTISIYEKAYIQ